VDVAIDLQEILHVYCHINWRRNVHTEMYGIENHIHWNSLKGS